MSAEHGLPPWRVGRKVGRTIYDANDNLIGVMDTSDMAELTVYSVNILDPGLPYLSLVEAMTNSAEHKLANDEQGGTP